MMYYDGVLICRTIFLKKIWYLTCEHLITGYQHRCLLLSN